MNVAASRVWPGRRSVAWRPGLMIVARSHYNFNPFLNLASEPFGPPWPLAVGTVGSGFSGHENSVHEVSRLPRRGQPGPLF